MSFVPLSFIARFGELDVYFEPDDQWTVQSGPHACDTVGLRARASLLWLPLLEHNYPAVRVALLAGLAQAGLQPVEHRMATFPVQDLLALALTSGASLYWVDLALNWVSHVGLAPDLIPVVRALALNPAIGQPTRHRAKRLYYTGKA
ncbi:hypothetical protein [Hymenobacter perfusus]|uniref:Uncharacterized protein n=1 Tax=Hymenobacter perfusus TaxID=1236770 RepID=A0A428JWE9_9BACT|nr:hypothetical protein [Hymenobacter perfusus]RSK38424.1 hypothetical protein EI293_21640 [Hymenobacter perfusus]